MNGSCRYCGQTRLISEQDIKEFFGEDVVIDDDMMDFLATKKCKCPQAEDERRKEQKLVAAGAWIENYFQNRPDAADAVKAFATIICNRTFSKISIKDGKRTYTVDLDKDDCIRIKAKYTDMNEETF